VHPTAANPAPAPAPKPERHLTSKICVLFYYTTNSFCYLMRTINLHLALRQLTALK
jgi:hypothetical protein